MRRFLLLQGHSVSIIIENTIRTIYGAKNIGHSNLELNDKNTAKILDSRRESNRKNVCLSLRLRFKLKLMDNPRCLTHTTRIIR